MVEVRDRNHTDRVHNEAMREKEENDKNLSCNTNANTKPTPQNPKHSPATPLHTTPHHPTPTKPSQARPNHQPPNHQPPNQAKPNQNQTKPHLYLFIY